MTVNWGYLTRVAIQEQFHNVQKGKPMRPSIALWLTILRPAPVADSGHKALKERGQSSRALAKEVIPPQEAEEPLPE